MARTIDPAAHATKRHEFLDAMDRLLTTRGFENASIKDILDATGASKGAFYHYFSSKQDLLEAVAERLAATIAESLRCAADAPDTTALQRLNRMFEALGSTKTGRREMISAMLQVWFSDANAAVRHRLRRGISKRIAPLLADIILQGNQEGTLSANPDFANIIAGLIQDLNDEIGQCLLLSKHSTKSAEYSLSDALDIAAAYTIAIERILGSPPGSIRLIDSDALVAWFRTQLV